MHPGLWYTVEDARHSRQACPCRFECIWCFELLPRLPQVLDPDGSGDMVQGEAVSIGRSVLAVFQRGQQIWSSAAAAQATGLLQRHLSMPP